jgi:cell division transport system ATP-binding protein
MMVQLQDVSVIYGDTCALSKVNLRVETGEFAFLVGATGAGKSTLMRLLYGAVKPTHGRVVLGGWDISNLKEREIPKLRRKMGIVPQDFALLPRKRVWENVAYGLRALGCPYREMQRRVAHALSLVGMGHLKDAQPEQLSGGEAQRVAIARAIANNPPLLIADEPTANLDPETSWGIFQLLQQINLRGATVVVSTHNRYIVDCMHKRVVALENGQVMSDVACGTYPEELDRTRIAVGR